MENDPSLTPNSGSPSQSSTSLYNFHLQSNSRVGELEMQVEIFEGTGKKRKVRCPGSHVIAFDNFQKHVENIHENHERSASFVTKSKNTGGFVRRKLFGSWSRIEFNKVNKVYFKTNLSLYASFIFYHVLLCYLLIIQYYINGLICRNKVNEVKR